MESLFPRKKGQGSELIMREASKTFRQDKLHFLNGFCFLVLGN